MAKKSEKLGIRLERDQLEYLQELKEEKGYSGRSRAVRQLIDFHQNLMRSPLSEILKDPSDMSGDLKKILEGGKITIPKDVRDELDLKKGDVISLNSDGSSNLILSKVQITRK